MSKQSEPHLVGALGSDGGILGGGLRLGDLLGVAAQVEFESKI